MNDTLLRQVISRMNLREVMVSPDHIQLVVSQLHMLAGVVHADMEKDEAYRKNQLVAAYGFAQNEQRKPFAFSQGVAIIPVHGVLINRFSSSWGFVTGYNFIRQQTAAAGQDPDVRGIVYDHNSNGGEAAGCFECAADIPKLANGKPTIAIIDSNCYSGSYALAVAADHIASIPSGGAGSIGVATMHVSLEKALADFGIKVELIFAGKHKVDGNPFNDLPDSVRADIQASVLKTYATFVGHVANYRKLDEKAVRATEARCYRADEAKSLGLIDAIAAPHEAMQAFMGELNGSNSQSLHKEDEMSGDTKTGDEKAAQEAREKQLQADAIKADRQRVSAITTCEEAKGRESLAQHFALNTDMTVDAAKAALAVAPKAEAAVTTNPLKEAMQQTKNPEVGDGGGEGGNGGENRVSTWLANARAGGVIAPAKH